MSNGGLAQITRRAAVSVGGETLDVVDLILLGMLTGDWFAFEDRVALGLGLERANPDAVSDDEVRREATAFRYAHGLISAADFRRWLEAREITVSEVSGVLRRRLLRRGCELPAGGEAGELDWCVRAESYCDGVLQRSAEMAIEWLAAGALMGASAAEGGERLDEAVGRARATRVAGLAELDAGELRARLGRLLSLKASLEQLRAEVAEPGAIVDRMREHGLDWLALAGDELCFDREGAAREARLLITSDGKTPAEVAVRADVPVVDRTVLVDEAPPSLGVSFAAAAVGEVIGPWQEAGRWRVMLLRAKTPPSPDNGLLRERAIEELLRERTRRHAAGRTTLHAPL